MLNQKMKSLWVMAYVLSKAQVFGPLHGGIRGRVGEVGVCGYSVMNSFYVFCCLLYSRTTPLKIAGNPCFPIEISLSNNLNCLFINIS